ncbi:hypothetical protein ACPDHJ_09200 [Myroides sp. C8-3]
MVSSLNHIISEIQRKENAISLSASNEIDEAYQTGESSEIDHLIPLKVIT